MLTKAYPELQNQRGLYDQIANDLHSRGLTGTDSLHTMMSGSGVYARRSTALGQDFLKFITAPGAMA